MLPSCQKQHPGTSSASVPHNTEQMCGNHPSLDLVWYGHTHSHIGPGISHPACYHRCLNGNRMVTANNDKDIDQNEARDRIWMEPADKTPEMQSHWFLISMQPMNLSVENVCFIEFECLFNSLQNILDLTILPGWLCLLLHMWCGSAEF